MIYTHYSFVLKFVFRGKNTKYSKLFRNPSFTVWIPLFWRLLQMAENDKTLQFVVRMKPSCWVGEQVSSSAQSRMSGRRTEKPPGPDTWETAKRQRGVAELRQETPSLVHTIKYVQVIIWFLSSSMRVTWISLDWGKTRDLRTPSWALPNTEQHFWPFSEHFTDQTLYDQHTCVGVLHSTLSMSPMIFPQSMCK